MAIVTISAQATALHRDAMVILRVSKEVWRDA
jgi:hypothetical protein